MKLDHHNIEEMMKVLQKYQLEEIFYEGEQGKIRLKSSSNLSTVCIEKPLEKGSSQEKEEHYEYITSEGIGKYYFIQENGVPYIEIGKSIKVGETIGYVTSIGISTPLISKKSGMVEDILVKNGDIIDFGKKLIKVRG